jgi:hypothetical protein
MRGSFVLDYSDDSEELEDHELKFMFAHEMTHGFVALFPEEDGEPNIWFADGALTGCSSSLSCVNAM